MNNLFHIIVIINSNIVLKCKCSRNKWNIKWRSRKCI